MKIYVTDDFFEFMALTNLTDAIIIKVANEVNSGLHDGNLDMGHLFKKRIASPKQSKRDSNRSVIAVQKDNRLFFIDGWRKCDVPKKGKEIPDNLLESYKLLGESFRNFTEAQIKQNLDDGLLREVKND